MQRRLLVSVRGKNDALEAIKGGAHIIDAEYPGSALGTCYPANINAIRKHTPPDRLISTNIGEKQFVWSTAGQAAVGVAYAGADIVKVGLAELPFNQAKRVMKNVVKQLRFFFNDTPKMAVTTLFADEYLRKILDPISKGWEVSVFAKADAVLIDTFDKQVEKGLLDWLSVKELKRFAKNCHDNNQEAWIAGSITKGQMPELWQTGIDVICVRGAACETGTGRQGKVSASKVKNLLKTREENVHLKN